MGKVLEHGELQMSVFSTKFENWKFEKYMGIFILFYFNAPKCAHIEKVAE